MTMHNTSGTIFQNQDSQVPHELEKKQAIENADTQGVAQENFPNLVNESQGTRDIGFERLSLMYYA